MYLYKYRCVRSDLLLSPSLFDWEELCTIDDKAIPYLSSLSPCEAPAGQWNKPCCCVHSNIFKIPLSTCTGYLW